ncbi:MAG TPA: O-antigen ligase family protein [Leptolyngbyaceae cyanobacterium M33_DOE_097]|uniref:O-antigen ligase family protein n=1 Tax=Oscillatoriales cyanobacterium SpSt-418 TaxID=2282169 RepID=A0A7C3KEL2_9CYAN|nr:O-antigen ligase family protein [Leptolyngbyaceae cyanobacterium M33_DOE_097]
MIFGQTVQDLRTDDVRDRPLRRWWNLIVWAYLLLPLFPVFGVAGLFIALVGVTICCWRPMLQRPLNRGFALVALLMIVSTLLAHRQLESLLGLFNFLPFFWVFAALAEVIRTPKQLRQLAWVLTLTSIPVVLIGLAQEFLGFGLLWNCGVVNWMIQVGGNPPGRISSVFVYANVLATYFCFTFAMSLGLWVEAIKTQRVAVPGLNPWQRYQPWWLGLVVLGNAAALVLTDSRNAWAIALFTIVIFAIYLNWNWLIAVITAISTAILVAAFAPAPIHSPFRQVVPAAVWMRLNDQLYPNRPVQDLRITQWQFAWGMFQQRPIFGWGLRNFTPLYQERYQVYIGHPHNLPLMLFSETGFLSTVLLLGLLAWVGYQGTRLLQTGSSLSIYHQKPRDRLILFVFLVAFGGYALFNLLDVTLFDVRINLMGWLLPAAIMGLVYQRNDPLGRIEPGEAG